MAVWLVCLWLAGPLMGADALRWDARKNVVSADITAWPLSRLLEGVAGSTGWDIFVEPDTSSQVSARFVEQPAGEALRKLLGKLNFALLPQTNAPSRLFIYRTSLQEATQKVQVARKRGGRTSKPIPDELVVNLKDGADINDIAARISAKVIGHIEGSDAYRLKFEDADAASTARGLLDGYDDVEGVDVNYYVERPPGAELLAASFSVPFTLNPVPSADGSKIVVGLIDTPIQAKGSPASSILLEGLSVFNTAYNPATGQPTHSTSMANGVGQGLSTALNGTSTSVRILPVDVYGPNANATTFDVAHGIVLAIQNGANIVNLSLGSEGDSSLLRTVIQNGSNNGVVFVGAAGNEPVATPFYPAAYEQVIAVTAGDRRGNISSYANHGDFVDVIAPGANVVQYNGSSYFVSGTSTSAAYVSGMVAGLASQNSLSVYDAAKQVRSAFSVYKPSK